MKIKVIDLLNKLANGEKVPEKIKFAGDVFTLEKDTYYRAGTLVSLDYIKLKRSFLNEEVEIIEEEPEIDIQDIKEIVAVKNEGNMFGGVYNNTCKINELIKAIKQLDKQIKEK